MNVRDFLMVAGRDGALTDPAVPIRSYRDGFGNWCTRLVAPQGHLRIHADAGGNDPTLETFVVRTEEVPPTREPLRAGAVSDYQFFR